MSWIQFMIVEPEDQLIVLLPERVSPDRAHLFSQENLRDLVVRVDEALVILMKGRRKQA